MVPDLIHDSLGQLSTRSEDHTNHTRKSSGGCGRVIKGLALTCTLKRVPHKKTVTESRTSDIFPESTSVMSPDTQPRTGLNQTRRT